MAKELLDILRHAGLEDIRRVADDKDAARAEAMSAPRKNRDMIEVDEGFEKLRLETEATLQKMLAAVDGMRELSSGLEIFTDEDGAKYQVLQEFDDDEEVLIEDTMSMLSVEARQVFDFYRRTFKRMCARNHEVFRGLGEFKRRHVAWATLRPASDQIIRLEMVAEPHAHLVLIPPGHPVLPQFTDLIKTNNDDKMVYMRPDSVSDLTAETSLGMAFSLLAANPGIRPVVNGIPVNDLALQHAIGHRTEIEIADAITRSAMSGAAEKLLAEFKVTSVDGVLNMLQLLNAADDKSRRFKESLKTKMASILGKKRNNYYDNTMVSSIMINAMAYRLIQKQTDDKREILLQMADYFRKMHTQQGIRI